MYRVGFIGCGNMGGALARSAAMGLGERIAVYDPIREKTDALAAELGYEQVSAEEIAAKAEFVVIGVKPQEIERVLTGLRPAFATNPSLVLVSMAVGVSIETLQAYAGGEYPVVRIMPNTPCMLGEGAVLYATKGVSPMQEKQFLFRMVGAGKFFKMDEEMMDVAGALSGCGPAYYYLFANGLSLGAEKLGLDRKTAIELAAQTMIGAGKMLQKYADPVDLKNKVCSPGGTTLAGVAALEEGDLEEVAASAVAAAYRRTLELKK